MEVHGLHEINRALEQLPGKVARKVLRRGVAAGAMLLRKEIKKQVPIRKTGYLGPKTLGKGQQETRLPGYLKKKISARYNKRRSKYTEVHYDVKPLGWGFYGYFVETGHGSATPKPFIIPTYTRVTTPIIDRLKEKLTEGILKEGKKLGFEIRL